MSTYYRDLAAGLRALAASIEHLDDSDVPGLRGKQPWVSMSIQPADYLDSDENQIAAVDAVAMAALGVPGALRDMSGGKFHHRAHGNLSGGIEIYVLAQVTSPEARALKAELEQLRAQVAAWGVTPASRTDPDERVAWVEEDFALKAQLDGEAQAELDAEREADPDGR